MYIFQVIFVALHWDSILPGAYITWIFQTAYATYFVKIYSWAAIEHLHSKGLQWDSLRSYLPIPTDAKIRSFGSQIFNPRIHAWRFVYKTDMKSIEINEMKVYQATMDPDILWVFRNSKESHGSPAATQLSSSPHAWFLGRKNWMKCTARCFDPHGFGLLQRCHVRKARKKNADTQKKSMASMGSSPDVIYLGDSENGGFSPQIIHFNIGFSIVNHPFWGPSPIFGVPPICLLLLLSTL